MSAFQVENTAIYQTALGAFVPEALQPALKYVDEFDFHEAPLSGIQAPAIAVTLYLITIYSMQAFVKSRKQEFDVTRAFGLHNLGLSVASLIMLVMTGIEVIRRSFAEETGAYWIFCENPAAKAVGPLYFWSYLYYLSKYVELFDTLYIAAKGSMKGWGGLQVYHHAGVMFMAWWWLEYVQTLQFLGLLFNTSVHVIMYYYFYLRSVNIKPWWRKYITMYQITQFVSSALLFLPTVYFLHRGDPCQGQYAMYLNLVFNITLLVQFVDLSQKPSASEQKAMDQKKGEKKTEKKSKKKSQKAD